MIYAKRFYTIIMRHASKGFTLVEIMIVTAIIAILLAIAIPGYVHMGNISKKNACIANLKQIDAAIDQWAIENGSADGAMPTEDIYTYVKGSARPACPSGGVYTFYPVGSRPQVKCNLENEGHTLTEPE